jgi:SprT protein
VKASQLLFRWATRARPAFESELPDEPNEELEERAKRMLIAIGCHDLARRLKVKWNARLSSTAGTASYALFQISLNPRLAEFGRAEIDTTLKHELAHLVAKFRSGRRRIKPHGQEWKQACADLGLPGEKRCHSLPLPRRQVARKHFYRCPQCKVEVQRVRPFRGRVACLTCCRKHSHGRYDDRFRLEKIAKGGTRLRENRQSDSAV